MGHLQPGRLGRANSRIAISGLEASPQPQHQGTSLLGPGGLQKPLENRQLPPTKAQLLWRPESHAGNLGRFLQPILPGMSDTITELESKSEFTAGSPTPDGSGQGGFDLGDRYADVVGKLNETLDSVDWSQVSKVAKASGIILAVIVAQILIKGVLDTINLLPLVPGLLELLGLVVVGQWSWRNLSTSEKRTSLVGRIQTLRKEYLG